MARTKKIKDEEATSTSSISEQDICALVDGITNGIKDALNGDIEIHFKKIDTDATLPTKSHKDDIGYDVTATSVDWDPDTDTYIYHTGLSWEAPNDIVCLGFSRSSNYKTNCYQTNFVGVIDPNYRGEIQWRFKNRTSLDELAEINGINDYISLPFWKKLTKKQREYNLNECKKIARMKICLNILDYAPYKVGDRIGQLVFVVRIPNTNIEEVEKLSNSDRGMCGFGSTGA